MGNFVDFNLLPSGDLELVLIPGLLDEDERKRLIEQSDMDALFDLLEYERCNGGPYVTDADALYRDGIQCLTSAPFIAAGEENPDSGHVGYWGTLWWFPDYQIESPVETLMTEGRVTFKRGIVLGSPVDCEACRRGGEPDGQPTGSRNRRGYCARSEEKLCPACRGRGFTLRPYVDEAEWRRKTMRDLRIKEG